MKYLITGHKGQLGTELSKLLPDAMLVDIDELNITDSAAVQDYVQEHGVDCIINCAAYRDIDQAEEETELAFAINAVGVANLAASGAAIIHLSTNYVFDGNSHHPYTPQDEPNPLTAYGTSKLAGEQALLELAETAVIIRTEWLYSPHGDNFVKTMLAKGAEQSEIDVAYDQIGTPTSAADLAKAIHKILEQLKPGTKGIYHYTNEGVCSWYDFAVEIMTQAKLPCKVNPVLSTQNPGQVPRPFYSVMDKSDIRKDFGIEIPHWKESLTACLRQML